MAPNGFMANATKTNYVAEEKGCEIDTKPESDTITGQQEQPLKMVNIISIASLHLLALYSAFEAPFRAKILSIVFCSIYGFMGGFGVTAGVHRLWAHKSYKAKLPLRMFLAACFSAAGQNTIPQWVLDHRVHHKFSETDADPHNSNRGFFFAHVGWLMQRKHPEVLTRGKSVDMSDIMSDPVVIYHTKYFIPLKIFFCFLLPVILPYYILGETLRTCILGNILRYCLSLNATWLVNSAAHIYGNRPFSTKIRPAENLAVSLVALGEGWHNYHHVFPWDYKAAEMGHILYNTTTVFLDMFASMGLAYDLKSPSKDLVEKVAKRYGDGSYNSAATTEHMHEVDENGQEIKQHEE